MMRAFKTRVHVKRLLAFGSIGGGVFVFGMALLYFLVSVMRLNETVAYVIQAVFSVLLSFFLNWKLTWADRRADLVRSVSRFVVMTAVTIPVNTVVFAVFVWAGLHYLIANITTIAIFTIIKYTVSHRWVFAPPSPLQDIDGDPSLTSSLFEANKHPGVVDAFDELDIEAAGMTYIGIGR